MKNAEGDILYVGKACQLKNRLNSYFQKNISTKAAALVSQIHTIELTVTETENDALLLESNLIKQHKPKYNVLLRDDKSYPYLFISTCDLFPKLSFHRGAQKQKGRYFGPYPNGSAVRQTVTLLQKLFKLRSCDDTFFNNRSRPCLQFQIHRCTGPCADKISTRDYQDQVKSAILFLEGKSEAIISDWVKKMDQASSIHAYERAAIYRDQIKQLRHIQEQHAMHAQHGEADIFGLALLKQKACISVVSVRQGRVLGAKSYFPKVPRGSLEPEILSAFVSQFYFMQPGIHPIPEEIILPFTLDELPWLEGALSLQAKRTIRLCSKVRKVRQTWQQLAKNNAAESLQQHLAQTSTVKQQLKELQQLLKLPELPQHMECFDISHSQGEATVASCVVFTTEGPDAKQYRRYNIKQATPGDDYAAMTEVLWRRYSRCKEQEAELPDIIIIDGGKGQLNCAFDVLNELQLTHICLLGISKGPGRKAGLETVRCQGQTDPLALEHHEHAFLLLQYIRDEAHRFAITGHRRQRASKRQQSLLVEIPGVGAKRRRLLLTHFGGLQQLQRASPDELAKVPGVSRALAQRIYDFFQKK